MAALSMCMFVDPDMLRGQTFTAPAVLAASVAARRAAQRRGKQRSTACRQSPATAVLAPKIREEHPSMSSVELLQGRLHKYFVRCVWSLYTVTVFMLFLVLWNGSRAVLKGGGGEGGEVGRRRMRPGEVVIIIIIIIISGSSSSSSSSSATTTTTTTTSTSSRRRRSRSRS